MTHCWRQQRHATNTSADMMRVTTCQVGMSMYWNGELHSVRSLIAVVCVFNAVINSLTQNYSTASPLPAREGL